MLEDLARDNRTQEHLSPVGRLHGALQLFRVRFLEHVPLGACSHTGKHRFRVVQHGHQDDPHVRVLAQDGAGGLDAVDARHCCQSAKVGQIGTREDYCYEELRVSSLRVLL